MITTKREPSMKTMQMIGLSTRGTIVMRISLNLNPSKLPPQVKWSERVTYPQGALGIKIWLLEIQSPMLWSAKLNFAFNF
jgi:hypothetical protein